MGMIGDFYVRLSAMTAPYTAALVEASDEGEAFAEANRAQMDAVKESNESGGLSFGLLGKAALGIGVAFVGISAVSMKWATSFQSTMELLHTQAGVAQSQLAGLGNGVLSLAGQVGFDPDSLAEALYHIESSFASVGITGPQAMNMLKIAAEGAAVGHANLVDVTNALDAAVVSGIPGVQNLSQAMGVLNATVGAGDMNMQDLANAFSTGLLANVKSYGLSITDVGAALAVFGDNNIRGQNAATDLRMAVQAMAVPAATAAGELQKMGLSTTSLATVMSKQGLLPALELLKQKMTAAGVTAQDQGEVLTNLFGKKAGAGIVVLYDQLDRLKSKYPVLTQSANNFGSAWTATKATVRQQLNEIGAGAQAAGIKFGQFLLPQAQKALNWITTNAPKAASTLSKDLSQLASGFSGPQAPATPNMGHAGLNQIAMHTAPPPLTAWQKIGQTAKQVAGDFAKFGKDVSKAATDIGNAIGPTAAVIGGAFLAALTTVGSLLANQVGPAIEALASFLDKHKQAVADFAKVALGLLAAKLTVIGATKAATGIVSLTNSILGFPKKQLDSITGAFGQLKTAWAGKAGDDGNMVGGLKNTLTSMGNTMRGGVRTALGWGKSIAGGIGTGLSNAGGAISGAFKKIMPTKLDFKLMLQSVKGAGGNVASTVSGWGSSIATSAKSAFSGIGSAAGTVLSNAKTWGTSVASSIGSGLSSAASGIATFASNVGTAAASLASSAWSGATEMLSGIGTSIASAATATWGWVTSAAAATVEAAGEAIAWTADKAALIGTTIAEKAAAAAQWLLDAAMDANPVGLIVIAITALVGVFVLLWTKCAWFRNLWKGLWSDIKKLFDDAVSFVKGHTTLLVAIIALPLVPLLELAKHWSQVWSDIKHWTSDAWNFLNSEVFQPVKRVFTQDIPSALHTAGQVFSTVWNGIQTAVSTVWNWVWGNVLQPIYNFFSATISTALNTAQTAWNSVWGVIQSTVQTVWGVIKPILDAINTAVSTISNALGKVTGLAGSVGKGVTGTLGKIGGFFGFDDGGYVPGAKGAPMFAIVHGGEYMLSNDMLSGRAPIDNRALAGVLSPSAAGGGGSASALAMRPGGGGGTVINQTIVNVNVAGNVTSEKRLADVVRTQVLQFSLRNSGNGLSLP